MLQVNWREISRNLSGPAAKLHNIAENDDYCTGSIAQLNLHRYYERLELESSGFVTTRRPSGEATVACTQDCQNPTFRVREQHAHSLVHAVASCDELDR